MSDTNGNDPAEIKELRSDHPRQAAVFAAVSKVLDRNQNAYWIAVMNKRALDREAVAFPQTASGIVINPEYQRRMKRAVEEIEQTQAEYDKALEKKREAERGLSRIEAALRLWDAQTARLAREAAAQAADEARLTPQQRALRDARRLLDSATIR